MIYAQGFPLLLVPTVCAKDVPRVEHDVVPPMPCTPVSPKEDVEVQRGGWYSSHRALAECIDHLSQRKSVIPSGSYQHERRTKRKVTKILPAGLVFLNGHNFPSQFLERGTNIIFCTPAWRKIA
jgi:hypothetical protein